MQTNLNNTFVLQTNDPNFEQALTHFLTEHCDSNLVNAAYYRLNRKGAEKVMNVVTEK